MSFFNPMNPAYSVSVLREKLTNQRPKGRSGIAPLSGAGDAASTSAGLAGAERARHELPGTRIGGGRLRRNGFVKGHKQSRFGSGSAVNAGNV